MVLEATVVCLDNSEWMRNADYTPTRMEAQHDAVNVICGAKTQQNPESTVACIAAAGKSPTVLVTLTADLGKMLSSLHNVKINGNLHFLETIQVAQLSLKHRQNKNQHQRIVFFVGSPVDVTQDALVALGRKLKKNNVAVDIINFGEQEQNTEKLEAFIQAVNNNDNSHLVNIPPGPHILSDIIITSPVITGEEGVVPPGLSSGGMGADMIDPNLDPELAMAIKASLEEAKAREEADSKKTGASESQQTSAPSDSSMDIEDDELARAIAMSVAASQPAPQQQQPPATPATPNAPITSNVPSTPSKDSEMKDIDDEDEEMKLAMQMSMAQSQQQPSGSNEVDISKFMEDPNFVNSVLSSLPGVDPNDETIKNVLAGISKPTEKKEEDKEKKQ